ncbi:MAG: HAMP domain-containing histidine kinase [Acidobacteriia bacterium]|nr:HAMP domain-containing histidine kinase [Terriglobia bacterium]
MSSPAAAELHQMAAIGRLLTGIVHEINSPLGSIFSNNEVIRRSLDMLLPLLADPSPESLQKARRVAETCRDLAAVDRIACERIRSVIRGLKSFSRLDSGEPREVDLNENLRDTLKLTQAEFRKRIAVETDLGELPPVECYPQMLNQVFLNLLINASQAIEGEGCIRVGTRLEDGMVRVSIADTGRGMTPEQQAKAFNAGFTTKPLGEGAGLGLSIAREIVEEKHGGSIHFESELGQGTTFHIRIPVRHPSGSVRT